ncbi:MAG: hypothetical protein QXR30_04585 [Candidatus Woesearchaeota archaeon]
MRSVLNFEISSIEAKKYGFAEKVEIKQGVSIVAIDLSNSVNNEQFSVLRVGFSYSCEYVNIGNITIRGNVLILEEKAKAEEIANRWKDKKEIEKELLELVLNLAYRNCTLEAIELSRKVNLPLPIQLPRIQVEAKDTKAETTTKIEEKQEEKEQKEKKETKKSKNN